MVISKNPFAYCKVFQNIHFSFLNITLSSSESELAGISKTQSSESDKYILISSFFDSSHALMF